MISPIDAYDALAPSYSSLAEVRSKYRTRVDEIVLAQSSGARSMLDVGAGDGRRGLEIGRRLGIERVVLLEPSSGMRSLCPEGVEVWPFCIEDLQPGRESFDLITCLWNVLGHVQGASPRVQSLTRLRESLTPNGTIFLDVSYRYNAAAYGWSRTLARLVHDAFVHSEANGDVTVSWQAGDGTIRTSGHVFTSWEMSTMFRAAGLVPVRRWVIDYDTGAVCRSPFSGHLLYQCKNTRAT